MAGFGIYIESRSPRMGLWVWFWPGDTRCRSCPGLYSVAATQLKTVGRSAVDRVVGTFVVAAAVLHVSPLMSRHF